VGEERNPIWRKSVATLNKILGTGKKGFIGKKKRSRQEKKEGGDPAPECNLVASGDSRSPLQTLTTRQGGLSYPWEGLEEENEREERKRLGKIKTAGLLVKKQTEKIGQGV